MTVTRRTLPIIVALSAGLVLTACSTGPTGSGAESTPDAAAGAADDSTADTSESDAAGSEDAGTALDTGTEDTGTFPTTVEHAFGETTIETDPQRIVTVGWSDHEVVAALGEVPVGAVKITWGGNESGSTDWFDAAVEDLGADPGDITRYDDADGIPVDEIATMEPDLIIGTNSGMTQEDYDRLSKIAPTVAYPEAAWGTPWRESVEMVGQAIGRPEQAQESIEQTEAAFEETAAEYPQLEGTSFAWGWFTPTDLSTIGLYTVSDLRPQFLTELGMVNASVVEELSESNETFSANLSAEQADSLDADVFIFYADGQLGGEDVMSDPLLAQIPAMESGAYVASTDQQAAVGMSSPSPLSIPFALEHFVPEVAQAAAEAAAEAEAEAR